MKKVSAENMANTSVKEQKKLNHWDLITHYLPYQLRQSWR